MSYLGVGIHKNLVVTAATGINDKGTFVLGLSSKPAEDDMMGAFDSGDSLETATNNLMMFPPNMTDWEGKAKTSSQIGDDLIKFKKTLADVLSVCVTTDKVNAALGSSVMFANLGVTKDNLPVKLMDENFVKAVYTNTANAFVAAMTPFYGNILFRVKLRRTSKAKHFAAIPPKGKIDEPWIESMQITDEQSKLLFTKWEITNGYDDGTPVPAEKPDEEAAEKVDNMFNVGASADGVTGSPGLDSEKSFDAAAPIAGTEAVEGNPFNQE